MENCKVVKEKWLEETGGKGQTLLEAIDESIDKVSELQIVQYNRSVEKIDRNYDDGKTGHLFGLPILQ